MLSTVPEYILQEMLCPVVVFQRAAYQEHCLPQAGTQDPTHRLLCSTESVARQERGIAVEDVITDFLVLPGFHQLHLLPQHLTADFWVLQQDSATVIILSQVVTGVLLFSVCLWLGMMPVAN